jgi:mono/diheme cytochrome c family protein
MAKQESGAHHTRAAKAFMAAVPLLVTGCGARRVPLPQLTETAPGMASAARGEYVVRNVAVCGHCHAADAKHDPDGALSGGMEFRNWRLGTVRASNLTADAETGLGGWSEAEIVRALRNGQRRDGRLLAPVMPYEWFHRMSDDDALAVSRYLKTLPGVRNQVTQSPNLIFKLGKVFFLRPKKAIPAAAPPRALTAEYGGYLARHVGLCADCHTPRGRLFAKPNKSRLFAGNARPPKGFPANPSNLTPDPTTGVGSWSEEDFLRTIRTGVDPAGRTLHSFMPWEQMRRMSDDDLRAIYRYLRFLRPSRNHVPRRATEPAGE